MDSNPLRHRGSEFRIYRMKQILLAKDSGYPPAVGTWETLQTLAELDEMHSVEQYEDYFARRVGDESHFGEICPQYSLMPPETYRRISSMGFETRLLFFMRDPTDRIASNIQHILRRKNCSVDDLIDSLTPDSLMYQRSDYCLTLDAYHRSGVDIPMKTFIYEELFNEDAVESLCDFLGIERKQADFEKRVNAARGVEITPSQKKCIRKKLEPVYAKLAENLDEKPTSWRW